MEDTESFKNYLISVKLTFLSYPYPSLISTQTVTRGSKATKEEKDLFGLHISVTVHHHHKGKSRRELKEEPGDRNWSEDHGGTLIAPRGLLSSLSYSTQENPPRGDLTHSEMGPPRLINDQSFPISSSHFHVCCAPPGYWDCSTPWVTVSDWVGMEN